jgi:hypothetical protein
MVRPARVSNAGKGKAVMFATSDPTGIWTMFFILCVVAGLWQLYMATFRTKEWTEMRKQEEERKKERDERIGKAINGASILVRTFLKK